MSNPKRPPPEQVATQIATTLPAGRSPGSGAMPPVQQAPQQGGDRRTAALPSAPVPLSAPTDRTMTFDPNATLAPPPQRRPTLPTVMSPQPEQALPPPPPRRSGSGRWVGGPLLAIGVGVATVLIAGAISGQPHAAQNLGHLRVSSDPEGATLLVNSKVQPNPTPTVIEGEIGATLHVGFRLHGYVDKETDVLVSEGERPFRAHLDQRDPPPKTPEPEPDPSSLAPQLPPSRTPVTKEDRAPRPRKESSHKDHVVQATPVFAPITAPVGGSGTLSVHVRPWAMVYIDGAKIRQTPVNGYSLTAGMHTVELVNDGLNKRERVTVDVKANDSGEVRRDWGEKDAR